MFLCGDEEAAADFVEIDSQLWRNFIELGSDNQIFSLQIFQRDGKHRVGDVWN